jgi:hypothetical protein
MDNFTIIFCFNLSMDKLNITSFPLSHSEFYHISLFLLAAVYIYTLGSQGTEFYTSEPC